ncbi:hypothetical protein P3S67_027266 [Capsicum chacoense]
MGSDGPKSVTIHVTGFKKFHGVSQNPPETAVNMLKDYVEKRRLPAGVTLGSCTVLEIVGESGLPTLLKVIEKEPLQETVQIMDKSYGILSGYGLAYKFYCGGVLFSKWQLQNLLCCLSSNEHHEMSIDARLGKEDHGF